MKWNYWVQNGAQKSIWSSPITSTVILSKGNLVRLAHRPVSIFDLHGMCTFSFQGWAIIIIKKEKKNRTTQIVIIIIIIIKQARGGMKKSIHFTMDSYSEPEFGLFFSGPWKIMHWIIFSILFFYITFTWCLMIFFICVLYHICDVKKCPAVTWYSILQNIV